MAQEIPSITFEELEQIPASDRLVLDVRPEDQFRAGSFPGAFHLPADDLESWLTTGKICSPYTDLADKLEHYPTERPVYIMCHTGERSGEDVALLRQKGCQAVNLTGGYRAYNTLKLRRLMSGAVQEPSKEQQLERQRDIERSIIKTYRKSIWRPFTKALKEYKLINDGDKIAVCISGGKDSMLMAKCMQEIQKHGIADFDLIFLCMDPGYAPENRHLIEHNAKVLGIPLTFFESEIFDTVVNIEQNPCYLCARMRRGYLYSNAKERGCNKIALGHHFDDVIETILMGMLYSAKVETMMPKLHSQNFEGMELIRPLYLVKEEAVKAWRDHNDLQFIQCACRFTEMCAACGGDHPSKRDEMKELIAEMRKTNPTVDTNIYNSVKNINLKTVIGYHKGDWSYNFLDDYDDPNGTGI